MRAHLLAPGVFDLAHEAQLRPSGQSETNLSRIDPNRTDAAAALDSGRLLFTQKQRHSLLTTVSG